MPRRQAARLKDLAKEVGVHVSTISRALNPKTRHRISPELVKLILEVAQRRDYRRNAAAAYLRKGQIGIIGLVIPDIANPVFPPIIHGIEDVLSERGYMVMLVNSETGSPRHADVVAELNSRGVDGMIVASLERNDKVVRGLFEDGLPIVTVNRRLEDLDVPSVTHDEDQGIRLILEHLRQLGHTSVVNIAGPQSVSTGKSRYVAFDRHARTLGFGTPAVVLAHGFNEAEGERCAAEALAAHAGFTAVVASNDRLAIGAISLLRTRGYACPGDVSVTGFNDMPMVERFEPALTTVRVKQYDAGREAAASLLRLLDGGLGEAGDLHKVMPVELVVRRSAAPVLTGRRRPRLAHG